MDNRRETRKIMETFGTWEWAYYFGNYNRADVLRRTTSSGKSNNITKINKTIQTYFFSQKVDLSNSK